MNLKKEDKSVFEAIDELLKQYDKAMFLCLMGAIKKNHGMFIKEFRKRLEDMENETP
jgi:hypothetical protein